MAFKTHAELVAALKKPGADILASLTPEKCDLWHMLTGLETEIGEIGDNLKAHVIYGKPLDVENLIEELGDLEFYVEGLRQTLALSRTETIFHNIAKLEKRYGERYSNEAALARVDKALPAALTADEEAGMRARGWEQLGEHGWCHVNGAAVQGHEGDSRWYSDLQKVSDDLRRPRTRAVVDYMSTFPSRKAPHELEAMTTEELIAEVERHRGIICLHGVPLSLPCGECGEPGREVDSSATAEALRAMKRAGDALTQHDDLKEGDRDA